MPAPLLSIVTPSLNQGRYIAECLESVAREMASPLAQRLGVEHIVMDGGSTDQTVGLLERATHLSHWQSEPDGGQSAAINRGLLDHATGRYATWLNADDWFEPGALQPMLERLTANEPPDVLVGRCRFVQDGHTIFAPRPPDPIDIASLLRLRTRWFAGQLIVQPEAFFDRGFFARVEGLNETNHFTMDHELWLRFLEAGARFESIDHAVACMRVHAEQKTADNRRIVESLIRHGRPFLDRSTSVMGEEVEHARREIDAMQRKLDVSEAVLGRLRSPWECRASSPTPSHEQPPGPTGFHLAPLRAVLAGVPSRRSFGRSLRTRVLGEAPIEQFPGSFRAMESGTIDAAVLWHALSSSGNAALILRDATTDLRPGTRVIAGAELRRCEAGLRDYTQGLASLIDQQLSENHEWLVDPAAMPWVESIANATQEDHARWLARHPSLLGLDLEAVMRELGFERVASMDYGGMSWHPLTPFEAIETMPGRDAHAWTCGVWRKK